MKYLSAAKAAAQLDVSEKTVRRWIADGKLKTLRIADKHGETQKFAIPESEVERLKRESLEQFKEDGTDVSTSSTDVSVSGMDMSVLLERLERVEREVHYQDNISDVGLLFGKTDALTERIEQLEERVLPLLARITDIEQAVQELRQLATPGATVDFGDIACLETQVNAVNERLSAVEHLLKRAIKPVETPTQAVAPTIQGEHTIAQKAATDATETSKKAGRPVGIKTQMDPPVEGAIPLKKFAEDHGISYNSIVKHAKNGLGPEQEKLPIFSRLKPGREHETEYYVLPGQEVGIADYARKYRTSYANFVVPQEPLPDDYVPLRQFTDQHKVARNDIEQKRKSGFIHVEKGNWTHEDKQITEALGPAGQRDVWVMFHDKSGFETCDDCPHEMKK